MSWLAIRTALGVAGGWLRAVPWQAWAGLAALLLIWAGVRRYHADIAAAYVQGSDEQATADYVVYRDAERLAAEDRHNDLVAHERAQDALNRRIGDAVAGRDVDIAGDIAARRLQWAQARADPGGTGPGGGAALPAGAGGADDTACAARGWVAFAAAATLAEAADIATARDDGWIDWYQGHLKSWADPPY